MWTCRNVSDRTASEAAAGFTLLEVMIAVSILALVLVALFRMQSGSIMLAQANAFHLSAPSLAERLISEIENDLAEWSQTEGEFEAPFEGFSWHCQTENGALGELEEISAEVSDRFYKIHVEITNNNGRKYSLDTWRLAPDE